MTWSNVPPAWFGVPVLLILQLVLIGILFSIGREAFLQIRERDFEMDAAYGVLLLFTCILFGILCWLWTPYL